MREQVTEIRVERNRYKYYVIYSTITEAGVYENRSKGMHKSKVTGWIVDNLEWEY